MEQKTTGFSHQISNCRRSLKANEVNTIGDTEITSLLLRRGKEGSFADHNQTQIWSMARSQLKGDQGDKRRFFGNKSADGEEGRWGQGRISPIKKTLISS